MATLRTKFRRRAFRASLSAALAAGAPALLACGAEAPSDAFEDGEEMGEVMAELTTVPTGVLCVKVDILPGPVSRTFTVAAGGSTSALDVGRLAAGETTFTPSAFNVACGSVGAGTTPDYVGSPVVVNVAPGLKPAVRLTLLPNVATTVGVDFPQLTTALSTGYTQAYAITSAGTVRSWGNNAYGQLGDGTTVNRLSPVNATQFTTVASISSGLQHTCFVTTAGALRCVGFNNMGQLGDGTTTNRTAPVTVISSGVAQVAAGFLHTCVRMTAGTIRCVGANESGQLGNGVTSTVATTAWQLLSSSAVIDIAAGHDHTCARRQDGGLMCWGSNTYGQMGNGTTGSPVVAPTYVNEASGLMFGGAAEVKVGVWSTCVRKYSGEVWCWGRNDQGQVGDGSTTDRSRPVQLNNIGSAVQLGAGSGSACARLQEGTVRCWGVGANGGLGDGRGKTALQPSTALGLTTAQDMAVGAAHTIVRLQSGALQSWGYNDSGQLGNGTLETRYVPSDVTW